MYKHYVRTNSSGEVIAAFSNAFVEPQDGDVLVATSSDRHFNPAVVSPDGVALLVVQDGCLRARTPEEVETIAAPMRERGLILARLEQLDRVIPRSVEDLYASTGTTPYESVYAALVEKAQLRAHLGSH